MAIEIHSLFKTYGKLKAVDNLSLTVPTGIIFGFLGPNGAGKTTAIKMLVGINKPDSGSIAIGGLAASAAPTREIIGFMPEEPRFYDQLTGLELIGFANNLFKKNRQSSPSELENILKTVGIYEARNKKIKNYSKGMKQRLGFAQALVSNPEYLFLDEPLEGLDPIGRMEIKTILTNLKKQSKTIFFNSHILADVENICDQIGIINLGKLIYSGPVDEFRKGKSLEEKFVEFIKSQ